MKVNRRIMIWIAVWLWAVALFLLFTGTHPVILGIVIASIIIERLLAQAAIAILWGLLVDAIRQNIVEHGDK